MGVLAAIFAHAGRIALDVAGLLVGLEKGGVNSLMICSSSSTSQFCAACSIAVLARAGSPSPDSTLQDWAMESIRHSSDCASRAACRRRSSRGDTIRRPSRRSRARFFSCVDMVAPGLGAPGVAARARRSARSRRSVFSRNQPSQTLSPRAVVADAVHAVVPVAAEDQRQAVRRRCARWRGRARARMLVERRGFAARSRA